MNVDRLINPFSVLHAYFERLVGDSPRMNILLSTWRRSLATAFDDSYKIEIFFFICSVLLDIFFNAYCLLRVTFRFGFANQTKASSIFPH